MDSPTVAASVFVFGDAYIAAGDLKKGLGQTQYSAGAAFDAAATTDFGNGQDAMSDEDWTEATMRFNLAKNDFDLAASKYEEACTDGFYEAYEEYDSALMEFNMLLMVLFM